MKYLIILVLFFNDHNSYSQKDTLVVNIKTLKFISNPLGGFSYRNNDTTFSYNGVSYRRNQLTNAQINLIIRYQIATNSLYPISIINDNGKIIETYFTTGEKKVGQYKSYYDNGILKNSGEYSKEGIKKKEGLWMYYSLEGLLMKEENYKNGKRKSCKKYK